MASTGRQGPRVHAGRFRTSGGIPVLETTADLPDTGKEGDLIAVQDVLYEWSPDLQQWVPKDRPSMYPDSDLNGYIRLPASLSRTTNRADPSGKAQAQDESNANGSITFDTQLSEAKNRADPSAKAQTQDESNANGSITFDTQLAEAKNRTDPSGKIGVDSGYTVV